MILSSMLDMKDKKTVILFIGVILVTTVCFVEKTKRISQYGVVLYEMGMRCNDECRQNKKIRYFQKAVYHNSNLSDAYYQLALIYEKKGEHDKALEFFHRVTELSSENSIAFYKMGVKYFEEGAYEFALRHFFQSNKYVGRQDDTFYYLARIYDQMEKYDLAAYYYYRSPIHYPECIVKSYSRFVEINHLLDKDDFTLSTINKMRVSNQHDMADQMEQALKAVQTSNSSNVLSDKSPN